MGGCLGMDFEEAGVTRPFLCWAFVGELAAGLASL